jgi:inosine/xanthosine triphosphatase
MKKVAVGSKNPVKIEAVRIAFEKVWPEEKWVIEGIEVNSEVSSQPMSDEETIQGAKNRALKALSGLSADFGVGLEGGLHQIGDQWFDTGWMVIIDKSGKEGIGSTVRAHTPHKMMEFVHKGIELGEACDILFNRKNTKHAEGQFGLLTKNLVTRTSGYVDGIIVALASFINPELFEK